MVAGVLKTNKNTNLTIPKKVLDLVIDSRRKIECWSLARFGSYQLYTHNLSKKIMMFKNKSAKCDALQVSKKFTSPLIVCVTFRIVMCHDSFPGLKRDCLSGPL